MSEENNEEVKMLKLQIEHLQAEVEALQQQKEDNRKVVTFHMGGQMKDALACLSGQAQGRGKEMLLTRLKEEVEEMEEDLKLQTQINGMNLKSCTRKTLQSSGGKLVQQICVSGFCADLNFQMEFLLSEATEGRRRERAVSHLNVVLDSGDPQNFSSFLSRVEENDDLLLFFRTLRTFSDRCSDRTRTFQHFQEKFPSAVSLPGGCRSEVMSINHPELPRCVLCVRWSVDVSTGGAVSPNISLLTTIPEEALQRFPSLSARGAAEAFHSLLSILGPEAAVESVIRAVSLSPDV
ncbi:centromere protein P [Xenentodon cancila]